MTAPVRTPKPKFRPYETWGACSRCGARVAYRTLKRERLTGLLVCSATSGRGVRSCWDPWPEVFDFQVSPDRSIEPPPEPLPARWNLDDIWGNGPSSGTTATYANAPAAAPDDATRLAALLRAPPYYATLGKTASFAGLQSLAQPVASEVANLNTILPADYDGTFIPSNSVRTVTPPNANAELANVRLYDPDRPATFTPGKSVLGGKDVLG
jgi:hypothetical protein